jgi:hypothetical protein
LLSSAGNPKGKSPGAFFFGYFLLGIQKKVTSRRATPGNIINEDNVSGKI